jgi:adenine nucleotide transporter 17
MESKGKQRRKNNKKNNEVNMNHHDETNLWRVIHQIVKKEGFLQLWNGTISSLLLVSNPIIQHFLYEQLRTQLLSFTQYRMKVKSNTRAQVESTSSLTPLEAFVLGAISKTVATVVTYPLQLAQVLLRLQSSSSDACEIDKDEMSSENNTAADATTTTTTRPFDQLNKTTPYKGVMHCLRQQFSYGGICSLFQGMNAKLLSTVLTAALTFLSYEQTLLLAEKMHQALLNER